VTDVPVRWPTSSASDSPCSDVWCVVSCWSGVFSFFDLFEANKNFLVKLVRMRAALASMGYLLCVKKIIYSNNFKIQSNL